MKTMNVKMMEFVGKIRYITTFRYQSSIDRASNRKTCMYIYSLVDGEKFGWEASDLRYPTLEDFTMNGRVCQSGLAHPISDTEANCTSLERVT